MKQRLYSVAFTVVLCALSAAALTFANSRWDPIYKENLKRDRYAAVIEAAGLVEKAPADVEDVRDIYNTHIRETKRESVLKILDGEKLVGWVIDAKGKGLEGPIKAMFAVAADKETILGFRVYEQEETPGIGSRIGDPEFTRNFPGKSIVGRDGPGIRVVKKPIAVNEVDAIVEASFTSRAVERMLNAAIVEFLAGRKLVPLVLDSPKPAYGEIPAALRESSAEVPTGLPRAPLMVPPGVTNIARGLRVRVTDDEEPMFGDLAQITDGEKEAGETSCVEIGFELQWVQIDFGEPHEIYAVVIWHDHSEPLVYRDVVVQVAADEEFAENVLTVFNNDRDDSSGLGVGTDREYFETYEGTLVNAKGAVGRYLRVYSCGHHDEETNRYTEIEVYGMPAPAGAAENAGDEEGAEE